MTVQGIAALVAGATGLVGGECVQQLAGVSRVARVVALVRRQPGVSPGDRIVPLVVDFERLSDSRAAFAGITHVFCALGTTIAVAGSQSAFRRVDFDYALEVATLGAELGARHLLLVSSLGANRSSRVFYTRVKGELESAVQKLPYRSITIARPSLLLGDRKEFRLGEALAKPFGFLIPGRYRPVEARAVARALVRAAVDDRPGVRILESEALRRAV